MTPRLEISFERLRPTNPFRLESLGGISDFTLCKETAESAPWSPRARFGKPIDFKVKSERRRAAVGV